MVAATIRTICAQSTAVQVRDQLNVAADMLGRRPPRSGRCCRTRPVTSPPSPTSRLHTWKQIWSTNPLERLNGEVKRRADVVQVFADRAAAVERLASAALADLHDGWQVSDRRYFSEASMVELLTDKPTGTPTNELTSQPGPTTPVE